MKIFYCAKCNSTKVDFKIATKKEEQIRGTWLNLRDGYGGAITHLICPECGYVLSGYIDWHDELNESIILYVKDSVEMYSTRKYEGGFLKEGAIDYICNCEIENKIDKYKDCNDDFTQGIIKSMSKLD